ncbi:hypothetical protein AGOR_G00051470 [Albula goreensis]|uniref:C2H2-type domain-containing protein n=1 Tax=Albula goreensis TaxID=1534307 RepID=A0A8T3E127_9TELE|nr:hypothetical protein AGOR_G00051470 [Albula goreensis]
MNNLLFAQQVLGVSFPSGDPNRHLMMPKRHHPQSLTSTVDDDNTEITVDLEESLSDDGTSISKTCPNEHNYSIFPSQEVLSVMVRHTCSTSSLHEEGQYQCSSCGKQYTYEHAYKRHLESMCVGHFKCSSCGKQYLYESSFQRHLRHLCVVKRDEESKKAIPKQDDPPLPRLRVRKPADNSSTFLKQDDPPLPQLRVRKPADNSSTFLKQVKKEERPQKTVPEPGHFKCSSCGKQYLYESSFQRHLRHLCVVKRDEESKKAIPKQDDPPLPRLRVRKPADNSSTFLKQGAIACPSCGKLYRYKSCYKAHRKTQCMNASAEMSYRPLEPASTEPYLEGEDPMSWIQQWLKDSLPTDQLIYSCSVPYCGESFTEERALLEHQREHLMWGTVNNDAFCENPESTHTDCLSKIQISNVMSLVTSRDEFLRITEEEAASAGKGKDPVCGNPSSGSGGKDVACCADKQSWRRWVQRCIQNHVQVRQKWLNSRKSGRKRVVCLLCGRRFSFNMALDQHVASAHCKQLSYPCSSCRISFQARTGLCRHVLQAHCAVLCLFRFEETGMLRVHNKVQSCPPPAKPCPQKALRSKAPVNPTFIPGQRH